MVIMYTNNFVDFYVLFMHLNSGLSLVGLLI